MQWIDLYNLYSLEGSIFHNDGIDLNPKESMMLSAFTLYIAKATSAIMLGAPIHKEIVRINDSKEIELINNKIRNGEDNEAIQHLISIDAIEQVTSICAVNKGDVIQLEKRHNAEPIISFFNDYIKAQSPNTILSIATFTTDVLRRNIDELSFNSQLSKPPTP